MFELRQVAGNVQFAALDVLVERGPLLDQQCADDDHRQDRDHQAHAEGKQRDQVTLPAKLQLQPMLQRGKHDAQDHRPEHRTVERQENPDKRQGDQDQQDHQ
ncbi:hypothetical protein D3C81_1903580 [compost metagenome]